MAGKIVRGLLILGAVGLAGFLIIRALRMKAGISPAPPQPTPIPIVLNGTGLPPPLPPTAPIMDGGGGLFLFSADTPIPTTSVSGPVTTQVGGAVITQFVEPEITEMRIVEQPSEPVLPTFEPTITTVGTGFAAFPRFGL